MRRRIGSLKTAIKPRVTGECCPENGGWMANHIESRKRTADADGGDGGWGT